MPDQEDLIDDLRTLNEISLALNRAVDMNSALNDAVDKLVKLMGLETGWIFLKDDAAKDHWWGSGYVLAAHANLPNGMALDQPEAWKKGCDCQGFCTTGKLTEAYNEVRCSRLGELKKGRAGLRIHASAPLQSGDSILGILNVAAPKWDSFTPRSLALLTNIGAQIGVALERARLYDLLREKRIHEQAALLKLSNQLLGRLKLDDLLNYLVGEVEDLLKADASAVFLLDEGGLTLSFRAASGWRQDPVREDRQVPADASSASGWVVHNRQPLVYHRGDPLPQVTIWTANWLAVEDFQSVAIVPMVSDERSIGTLAVSMRQYRQFEEEDIRFLQLMANQAAVAVEQARLYESEIHRQRLEEELAVGRKIQLSLLPKACPIVQGWSFCDFYQAARQVGGDFYDFFFLPDQNDMMALVIADVSDKGVPAALFMGVSRTIIRSTAMLGKSPKSTLTRANGLMFAESQAELFLSVFYAQLNLKNGEISYCNAGHNPPLHYRAASRTFQELNTDGIVLGIFETVTLEQQSTIVVSDDILVFYTDGVTEAMNSHYEEFDVRRLKEIISMNSHCSATEIMRAIVDAVGHFTGEFEQSDDFTLFVVKRL